MLVLLLLRFIDILVLVAVVLLRQYMKINAVRFASLPSLRSIKATVYGSPMQAIDLDLYKIRLQ